MFSRNIGDKIIKKSNSSFLFDLRSLSTTDMAAMSIIHGLCFPTSFLTRLGHETVRRYYEWQFIGPHSYHRYGVYDGKLLIGYCISGLTHMSMTGYLKRNAIYLSVQVLLNARWIVTDQFMRSRIKLGMQTLTNPSNHNHVLESGIRQARILVIATNPQYQRRGIGKILLHNAENLAIKDGFNQMGLTVHVDNEPAKRFYEHFGWQKVILNDIWTGQMIKPLTG